MLEMMGAKRILVQSHQHTGGRTDRQIKHLDIKGKALIAGGQTDREEKTSEEEDKREKTRGKSR